MRSRLRRRVDGQLAQIREWAKANGYKVSDRGRIPQDVEDAARRLTEKSRGAVNSSGGLKVKGSDRCAGTWVRGRCWMSSSRATIAASGYVFIDAIDVKIRDAPVGNRPYAAIGVDLDGHRDIPQDLRL